MQICGRKFVNLENVGGGYYIYLLLNLSRLGKEMDSVNELAENDYVVGLI